MSIEAAIKIFDPRTVKLDGGRGRASLHWDDIASMLGTVERSNPVGYQLMMVKFRDDQRQEVALRENVSSWAKKLCLKNRLCDEPLIVRMCQTAVDLLFHRPLNTQQRSLQHLHRLYGPYARRESTRMKKLKKILSSELKKPDSLQRADRIFLLEEQIATSRQHINAWVEAHAKASTQCPRCRGTGVITLPHHGKCPVCNGDRFIPPSHKEVVRHISSNSAFVEGHWFVMDECRWWLADCANAAATHLHELFDLNTNELT